MQIEQKIDLVKALIAGELAEIQGKAGFWNTKLPIEGSPALFQKQNSLTLDQVLPTISQNDLLNADAEAVQIIGVAWEFVWGKQPPEIITETKQSIRTKAECGLQMNDLEKLWYQLSAIDTDMF